MFVRGANEGWGRGAGASVELVEIGCRVVIVVGMRRTYHEYDR